MCRMCLVEVSGPRGADAAAGLLRAPWPRAWRCVTDSDKVQEGPGRRARVPARQPPARLPGLRQGRRVPAAGPGPGLRAGREPLRRGEAALRQADRHRPSSCCSTASAASSARAAPASPTRWPATPLIDFVGPRRRRRGATSSPAEPFDSYFSRQHRADLPGRRAHRHALPLQGPARGTSSRSRPPARRCAVGCRVAVQSSAQPHHPLPRRGLRSGQPGLAVRQGPLRLRGGPTPTTGSTDPLVRRDGSLVPASLARGARAGGRG